MDESFAETGAIGSAAFSERTLSASIRRGLLRIESTAIMALAAALAGVSLHF